MKEQTSTLSLLSVFTKTRGEIENSANVIDNIKKGYKLGSTIIYGKGIPPRFKGEFPVALVNLLTCYIVLLELGSI